MAGISGNKKVYIISNNNIKCELCLYIPRVLCIITYLFAIGITIWALYQPYMTTEIYGDKIDEYFDK